MSPIRFSGYACAIPLVHADGDLRVRLFRVIQSRLAAGHSLRLGAKWAFCPVCEGHRMLVRLGDDEMLVRCVACRSSAVTMSMAAALAEVGVSLADAHVFELSCRGALHRYLKKRAAGLTCSEYHPDAEPGEVRDGVLCQDVQRLTFPDATFDLCTSTEVFEHVPDDRLGFRQIHRVLRPGGILLFTVPLSGLTQTLERARLEPSGEITHLLPAEYHVDPAKQDAAVLAFRDYGDDLLGRLLDVGFASAEFLTPEHAVPWGYTRTLVVARKAGPVVTDWPV
jgi:SAM-dependent methyltransferase